VWLYDKYLGESPVKAHFTNSEWSAALRKNKNTMPYRLELDGYETREGRIPIRVSAFRIWSNASFLFIPYLFRRSFRPPRAEYSFDLVPIGGATRAGEERLSPAIRQRLRELDGMLEQRTINRREYEALRVQILKDVLVLPPARSEERAE
jgi:hypothetical protein